jgi:hypothetical protein
LFRDEILAGKGPNVLLAQQALVAQSLLGYSYAQVIIENRRTPFSPQYSAARTKSGTMKKLPLLWVGIPNLPSYLGSPN